MNFQNLFYSLALLSSTALAKEKPNVVVIFADDISAREFPIYGSSVWSKPDGGDCSDQKYRAQTPVIDRLAKEGCWIKTCWAATVSSPSRAQMMTGRYAHLHKWWHNKDTGEWVNAKGKVEKWPLYESSPLQLGKLAQNAGYATFWGGKTQMPYCVDNIDKYGFDEGCYTPGELTGANSDLTDFRMERVKNKKGTYRIVDSGREVETYMQISYYWKPSVVLVNNPECKDKCTIWPNTATSKKEFGLNTYGPDVEQKFIFDFMDREKKQNKPFFIYHTTHLGHAAYNFFLPDTKTKWPGTPKVKWVNGKYVRTTPNVTGNGGVYDLHNSITEPGINNHVNYIDYLVWRYLQKLKELGIEKNTVLIICADNGTSDYGKASPDLQKGTHVPMIIYAPGLKMKKHGEQDILMNIADVLPTVADLANIKIPSDYPINGVSILPYLTTDKKDHRDWVYAYRNDMQLSRGKTVMKDGRDKWYDVTKNPKDLISFPQITDWSKASPEQIAERDKLIGVMKQFDLYKKEHDAPGFDSNLSTKKVKVNGKAKGNKEKQINKNKKNKKTVS